MDPNLLTLYLVAGGLSLSLHLVLTVFARFLPGAVLARHWAAAILVLSIAYTAAGLAPLLPRWMMVLGTNMLLLAGCVMLYEAITSYCTGNEILRDRFGWSVILLTAPFFFYWGLLEPNGNYRSVVFSMAAALINGRTASVLAHSAKRNHHSPPLWVLAILFVAAVAWMLARAGILMIAEPVPIDLRGSNPTTWASVFFYILLVSAMSIIVMWIEVHRGRLKDMPRGLQPIPHMAKGFDHKLLVLWSGVVVMIVAITAALSIAYTSFYSDKHARMVRAAQFANKAMVAHTEQVVRQTGTVLNALVREYERTRSAAGLKHFVQMLAVDRTTIDGIDLISADGTSQLAQGNRDVSASEYFRFHRDHVGTDTLVSTNSGSNPSGRLRLHISRRIDTTNGSFGGAIVMTANPVAFTHYNAELAMEVESFAAMIETTSHRLLVRMPDDANEVGTAPAASPFWDMFERSPSGIYEGLSYFGDVRGVFAYQAAGALPIVLMNGFTQANLLDSVHARMRWMVLISVLVLVFSMILALLLTVEAKHNDDKDRFMSMLNHELKTPMSVVRMALGFEGVSPDIQRRISRAVADMSAVIDRCLQADRLHHGRIQNATTTCRIDSLVDRIRAECAQPERLSVQYAEVPSCITDEQLLGLIISNLVDNALKYGAAYDAINVIVERAERKRSAGVRISVTNAPGVAGMPDPHQVFRKYYRAPGAHGKTGSGLGLHISAGIARQLGGELRYLPSAGKVNFELWIPA